MSKKVLELLKSVIQIIRKPRSEKKQSQAVIGRQNAKPTVNKRNVSFVDVCSIVIVVLFENFSQGQQSTKDSSGAKSTT